MVSLSTTIIALASATLLDLYRPLQRNRVLGPREELAWSRIFTLLWGLALVGGAVLFTDTKNPVVELGLRIASITYGGLLGVFFLGLASRRVQERDALYGFAAGLLAMSAVVLRTRIDFVWHTLIGCVATLAVGIISSALRGHARR
jgi:Na+/proline symporter